MRSAFAVVTARLAFRVLMLSLLLLLPASCTVGSAGMSPQRSAGQLAVHLSDFHGLWGGYDLKIFEDRTMWVREVGVDKMGRERRFLAAMSASEFAELKKFIIGVKFFQYREHFRSGVPDEARPTIYAHFDGKDSACSKWAGDKDPRFDSVYQRLQDYIAKIVKTTPVWTGSFKVDAAWPVILNAAKT